MKQYGLPYKITSTVTEVADGQETKVIEWQHPLGHRWRWSLTEATPGDTTITEVTETFDYSTAKVPLMITASDTTRRTATASPRHWSALRNATAVSQGLGALARPPAGWARPGPPRM